jgi:hypothetical protein
LFLASDLKEILKCVLGEPCKIKQECGTYKAQQKLRESSSAKRSGGVISGEDLICCESGRTRRPDLISREFPECAISGRTRKSKLKGISRMRDFRKNKKISFEGNFQNEVISGRTRKSHLKGISRMHNQNPILDGSLSRSQKLISWWRMLKICVEIRFES